MHIQFVARFVAFSIIVTLLVQALRLWRNVRRAKRTGLPTVITPLLETQVLAQLLTPLLRALYMKHLDKGKGWPRWCRFMIKDWSWEDKRLVHEEYGDVFICVSPEGMICYSADAAMGWDVMNRRYDFTKPRDKYKILEPYGPNVATAEGAEYRFHVRITGPAFSEGSGVNHLVWDETMRQTQALLKSWQDNPPEDLHNDVNALTLAVISLAGFGRKLESVAEQAKDVPPGYKISFLRAISDTTTWMFAILVFPRWLLRLSPWAKAQLAHSQLEQYLRNMIHTEREVLENEAGRKHDGQRKNLLHMIIRSSYEAGQGQQDKQIDKEKTRKKHAFTENEVMGNLFIYLLAGYETTANSIAYGLIALALDPALQALLAKTVDDVWHRAAEQGRKELTYQDDFAELQYLYGFMYETFRLYPGVTLITKVCLQNQTVHVGDQSHVLPAGCRVYLSAPGVHYSKKYWEDPTRLLPERWKSTFTVQSDEKKNDEVAGSTVKDGKASTVAADKTRQMRGTLLTFSDGARACLGRKFAQAEYMAFFAALLRQYQVCFAEGTDVEQARRDLDLKCAGKVTLAPLANFRLTLKSRRE